MKILKILFKFFSYSKFKEFIIVLQIILSVYFLTSFLTPFIKNIDTIAMISKINLDNKKLFIEALHIKSSYATTNRNKNYENINNYLKGFDNIKNSSGVIQIHTQKANVNTFAYDKPFCYDIKLPLYKGNWLNDLNEDGIITVIVSYELKEQYPINSIIDLEVECKETNTHIDVKTKVVGILKKNGYVFIRWYEQ